MNNLESLTNRKKILCIISFPVILLLIFYLTFGLPGRSLCLLFQAAFDSWLKRFNLVLDLLQVKQEIIDLIVEGVFGGITGVLSFIPSLCVLFVCLSLMEESGYTSMISLCLEKPLSKAGLNADSLIPIITSLGCSVPAIILSGNLKNREEGLRTARLIPFVSCSARLPVYLMITSFVFPQSQLFAVAGIYILSITITLVAAFVLSPYAGTTKISDIVFTGLKKPDIKRVCNTVWQNGSSLVKKAFTVIFISSVLVWLCQNYTPSLVKAQIPENSIIACLGQLISPLLMPIGLGSSQTSAALISGLFAKESIVSTFSIMGMPEELLQPASALSFMVFCLIYAPCIATLTSIVKVYGHKIYAFRTLIIHMVLAWIASFITYNLCLLL